jgi:CheY-like chemotaxis protein
MAAVLLSQVGSMASLRRDMNASVDSAADSSLRSPLTLTGIRVLLVEDDNDTREVMQFMLERWGADVTAASSVREALEMMERRPPTIIISDIAMPEEDGYVLIRKMHARGLRIPAVALTAFSRAHDREHALTAGFHAHLSKPIDADVFRTTIARLTARS